MKRIGTALLFCSTAALHHLQEQERKEARKAAEGPPSKGHTVACLCSCMCVRVLRVCVCVRVCMCVCVCVKTLFLS